MKYVILEEELKDFAIKCVNDDGVGELSIDVRIQDLTQSKTPVEEIAEGEIKFNNFSCRVEIDNGKETTSLDSIIAKQYEKYIEYNPNKNPMVTNKNIKIYIEVNK